jgi:hypothetical protein
LRAGSPVGKILVEIANYRIYRAHKFMRDAKKALANKKRKGYKVNQNWGRRYKVQETGILRRRDYETILRDSPGRRHGRHDGRRSGLRGLQGPMG